MAYQLHELGALVRFHPVKAARRILAAYRRAQGLTPKAAELLGVARVTLTRWTTLLELRARVDGIRVRAGRRPSTTYNPNPHARKKRPRRSNSSLNRP